MQPSTERGFVRVSARDPRYFEFEDGSLFLGLGYNGGIDWFNPVRSSEARLATMGDHGVSLSRIWLSQSGIYGSAWNPWYGLRGDYGGYIPRTGVTPAGSPATMQLRLTYAESGGNRNTGYFEACRFIGGFQSATAVKRQTTYRFRVRYCGRRHERPAQPESPQLRVRAQDAEPGGRQLAHATATTPAPATAPAR